MPPAAAHGLALGLTLAVNLGLLLGLAALRAAPPAPTPPPPPLARIRTVAPPPPPPPPAPPAAEAPPEALGPPALPALDLPSPVPAVALGDPGDLALGGVGALQPALGEGALRLPAADQLVLDDSLVDTPPKPLHTPPPRYPPGARAAEREGEVRLRLLIGLDGAVERAELDAAEPPGIFEAAAQAAVTRWRFQPATFEGRPVRAWAQQTLRFTLR